MGQYRKEKVKSNRNKVRRHHPGGQREHHEQAGNRTELISGMLPTLGHKVGAHRCGVTQNSRHHQVNDEHRTSGTLCP